MLLLKTKKLGELHGLRQRINVYRRKKGRGKRWGHQRTMGGGGRTKELIVSYN